MLAVVFYVSSQPVDYREHFALNSSVPVGVQIVTDTSLNYEVIRSYEITVTASDGGDPVLSRCMYWTVMCAASFMWCVLCRERRVSIVVVDVNDHAPVFFTDTNYTEEINENSGFMRFPNFFRASDADSGSNGMITFIPSDADSMSLH